MRKHVFVPCTDEQMADLEGTTTPLVPYHPDRPCLRQSPAAPEPERGGRRWPESHQSGAPAASR